MDPASNAVFGSLLLNIIVTSLIIMGWLIIRKYRGDKSVVNNDHRSSMKSDQFRVSAISSGGNQQR